MKRYEAELKTPEDSKGVRLEELDKPETEQLKPSGITIYIDGEDLEKIDNINIYLK